MNAGPVFTFDSDDMETVDEAKTIYSDNDDNDDELDRQIEEAIAHKSEYDDWKMQLIADCQRKGISIPSGYALQRAWNAEQKRRGEERKQQKAKDKRITNIKAQIKTLQLELAQLQKIAIIDSVNSVEETEPDFDAITADLLKLQERRNSKHSSIEQDNIPDLEDINSFLVEGNNKEDYR